MHCVPWLEVRAIWSSRERTCCLRLSFLRSDETLAADVSDQFQGSMRARLLKTMKTAAAIECLRELMDSTRVGIKMRMTSGATC